MFDEFKDDVTRYLTLVAELHQVRLVLYGDEYAEDHEVGSHPGLDQDDVSYEAWRTREYALEGDEQELVESIERKTGAWLARELATRLGQPDAELVSDERFQRMHPAYGTFVIVHERQYVCTTRLQPEGQLEWIIEAGPKGSKVIRSSDGGSLDTVVAAHRAGAVSQNER